MSTYKFAVNNIIFDKILDDINNIFNAGSFTDLYRLKLLEDMNTNESWEC
jgi:hypothetical protein